MISDTFYTYFGLQSPFASHPIEELISPDRIKPTFVAMNQEEYDYLHGMQYLLGSQLKIVLFQDFHDEAYENYKQVPLSEIMQSVACSYSYLHDLMMSPMGDLQWKKIDKERHERLWCKDNPMVEFI